MNEQQLLIWLYDYARENFKGDINLAILDLQLKGIYKGDYIWMKT